MKATGSVLVAASGMVAFPTLCGWAFHFVPGRNVPETPLIAGTGLTLALLAAGAAFYYLVPARRKKAKTTPA